MKLENAVRMGIVCGLNTVEECIENVQIHWMSIFAYDVVIKETTELYEEYSKYLSGELEINWKQLEEEENKKLEEFFNQLEK